MATRNVGLRCGCSHPEGDGMDIETTVVDCETHGLTTIAWMMGEASWERDPETGWQQLHESVPYRNGRPWKLDEGQSQWMNDLYIVMKTVIARNEAGEPAAVHLSIRRTDRAPAREWRHFQRIKTQLCGPDWEAVELYPAESRVVDSANQYHLWCLNDTFPLGFNDGRLVSDENLDDGAVQEPLDDADVQYGGRTPPEQFNDRLALYVSKHQEEDE